MPVEIRELVIRATITNGDASDGNNGQPEPLIPDQQQLVQECVEQVLKIIKQSQNR